MSTYDSSLTRVPVFNALLDRDPSGDTWLLPLLQFGSRSPGRLDGLLTGRLLPGHPRWWGKNERRLEPPRSLLRWLVAHACAPASDDLWGSPATKAKRESLVARDAATIDEALRLLETAPTLRKWYVLEGRSQPDACLETDTILLVIEGKRTEHKATAVTADAAPKPDAQTYGCCVGHPWREARTRADDRRRPGWGRRHHPGQPLVERSECPGARHDSRGQPSPQESSGTPSDRRGVPGCSDVATSVLGIRTGLASTS